MKIQRKIASLFRRKVPFFALTYNWHSKDYEMVPTFEQYVETLEELKAEGMCKRGEWFGSQLLQVCGQHYDVLLVSFGDIRANKFVFGQSPLAIAFGVCLFDYVFAFIVKSDTSNSSTQGKLQPVDKSLQS